MRADARVSSVPGRTVVRVAVDALGGDRGPDEVVAGAVAAATDSIQPILFGPPGLDARGLTLVETDGAVEMDDKPADAVRSKPGSSVSIPIDRTAWTPRGVRPSPQTFSRG